MRGYPRVSSKTAIRRSGQAGEFMMASILNSLPSCYYIINDLLIKTSRGTTQIDHVVVSPFGIFVIETKNHKGMIFGDCYSKVWTQVLYNHSRYTMYSPVLQNQGHIKALNKQAGIPYECMQGAVVFTNPDANLSNVDCPFCFNPEQLYYFITSFNNIIFNEYQVVYIANILQSLHRGSQYYRRKHNKYVEGLRNYSGY